MESSVQTYGALVQGLEYVSMIVSRYTQVERTYIRGTSTYQKHLTTSLVQLYACVLRYLIAADEYFGQSRARRYFKNVLPKIRSSPDELLQRVRAAEKDAKEAFSFVEAEGLSLLNKLFRQLTEFKT